MNDARHLRAVNPDGELVEDVTPIPTSEAMLVEEIVDLRRKLAHAKGEITKLHKVNPEVSEILEYWHVKCKNRNPRVQIPLGGARAKAVGAMLKTGYSADELKQCIDRVAERPFLHYGRRYCEPGPGRVRRDDLTLLFRDEAHVEQLLALEPESGHDEYRVWLAEQCRCKPGLVRALAFLAELEPHGSVIASAAVWARTQT